MSRATDELRILVESALEAAVPVSGLPGNKRLNDAVRDAVFPGGKRLRPVFTMLAAHAAGVPAAKVLDAACAVEFLHCSSLVFDDLPCMDDAGLRRNRPTLHMLYGESVALLAGLALFNEAYRLFGRYPQLVAEAADCVGVDGMIGGQCVDIGGNSPDLRSRDCKTSSLMRLTFVAGPVCGSANPRAIELLGECGERLGQAYQVLDDLMDSSPGTGKTAAQDERHHRCSHGIAEVRNQVCPRERAVEEMRACCELLVSEFGTRACGLTSAIQTIFARVLEAGLVAV